MAGRAESSGPIGGMAASQVHRAGEAEVMYCQAAVISHPGEAPQVTDVPVPDLEPGGMLVQVETATLCGTDVHFWHATVDQGPSHPYIPGHESVGRIVDIAGRRRDVDGADLQVGDRVIWTYPFCRQCFYCSTAGEPTLCTHMHRFGRSRSDLFPFLLGACAEYQYVPPGSDVISVPDEVTPALASASSCAVRTVMHALERIGPLAPEHTVLVQGCGAVGLFAIAAARAFGAGPILVIGDPPERHDLALRLGASDTRGLTCGIDERKAWVWDQTRGRGADVVVECATAAAISEGIDLTRPGGRFVAVGGGPGGPSISSSLLAKTLTITSIRGGEGRHYRRAIDFLLTVPPGTFDDLFHQSFDLAGTSTALEAMASQAQPKPVICPI